MALLINMPAKPKVMPGASSNAGKKDAGPKSTIAAKSTAKKTTTPRDPALASMMKDWAKGKRGPKKGQKYYKEHTAWKKKNAS